jgi:preprotein translocase subunit SecB
MSEQHQALNIGKIYLKDLSLEIPGAPQIFNELRTEPRVDINLHNEVKTLEAGIYEITLTATVTATLSEKTVFLVEAAQAGVFQIREVGQEELASVINVTCPRILLPFLRETVAAVLARAGFPPVQLPHVGFETIYRQRLQEQEQQQAQAGGAPAA